MSQRKQPPSNTPGPNRLAEVLAAGLEQQLSIGKPVARDSLLERKAQRDAKPPDKSGRGGITKPDQQLKDRVKKFVRAQQTTTVSMQDELAVMQDVYNSIDTFLPCPASPHVPALLQSVGACRYFEHNGLMDTESMAAFLEAAALFVAYLEIEEDFAAASAAAGPASTGAYFDDAQRGQISRTVFNEVGLKPLFDEYFGNVGNFVSYVKEGEWAKATEMLVLFGPLLYNIVIGALNALPKGWGPGNDVLNSLNYQYEKQRRRDPATFIGGFSKRAKWAENAEVWHTRWRY